MAHGAGDGSVLQRHARAGALGSGQAGAARKASPSSPAGHRFNHDLLVHEADQAAMRRAFPELVHIFEFPELIELFQIRERAASQAKRRSRVAGFAAIAIGGLALVMAAFESVFDSLNVQFLAPLAAGLGALSVLAGSRILHGSAKRAWLRDRLMAERLRQLHFQAFALKLPSMARSLDGPVAREAFLEERRRWLQAFQFRFEGGEDAELSMALDDEDSEELWLIHPADATPEDLGLEGLDPLLQAYRMLRLDHQIQFTSVKLDGAPGSVSEVRRAERFSQLLVATIIATLALHGTVLSLFAIKLFHPGFTMPAYAGYAPVAASLIAAVVLTSRALEEGLQPGREVERYLQYRATMRTIRARFDHAETIEDKLAAMRAGEQAVYSEMCTFLKIHNEAKFRM